MNQRFCGALLVLPLLLLSGCSSQTDEVPAGTEVAWTLPSDAEIQVLVAERAEAGTLGLVVGVIDRNGRRFFSHGSSGAGNGRPLDERTVFQIGSVSKPITALLLADMASRGEVGLDDPAVAHVPNGVPLPERGRAITLRDLATHRSGLPSMPSNFDVEAKPDPIEGYTVEDLWDFLSTYELSREPGTEYEYSNLGVSLLGRLLGLRMGTTYEELVTARVLGPLGMASTSISLNEDQEARLAPGHGPYFLPVRSWEMATLQASGSLRSTGEDLLDLVEAYLGYSDGPLREAMELQLSPDGADARALGWGRGIREDGTVRHSGGKAGYRSGIVFNPNTGIGAVVLTNTRTFDTPMGLADYLVNGTPMPPPVRAPTKSSVQLPGADLDAVVGRYRLEGGGDIEVVRMGEDRLMMMYEDAAIWEFAATSPTEFFLVSGNDDVVFEINDRGFVTGLLRYGDGLTGGGAEPAARVR